MKVIFDLDGTLVDSRASIVCCLKQSLLGVAHPIPPDSDLKQYIGQPIRQILRLLLGAPSEEKLEKAVLLFRDNFSSKGILQSEAYPGIAEVLNGLHAQHFGLYVASARPQPFAVRTLEHCGIDIYFQRIFGCEFDGTWSDKSEIIGHILKSESLPFFSTVLVGDRADDIVAARRNGIPGIGALWGYGSREELVSAGAYDLCQKPNELRSTLLYVQHRLLTGCAGDPRIVDSPGSLKDT